MTKPLTAEEIAAQSQPGDGPASAVMRAMAKRARPWTAARQAAVEKAARAACKPGKKRGAKPGVKKNVAS